MSGLALVHDRANVFSGECPGDVACAADIENDDWYIVVLTQGESCRVHDLEVLVDGALCAAGPAFLLHPCLLSQS